jgi:uncharacterized protein (DUF433 family)
MVTYAFSGAAKIGLRAGDHNRITIEPGKRSGQPCLGLAHHSVGCAGWLAAGRSQEQIISD